MTSDNEAPPTRGKQHDALAVFLGHWRAEGNSYGSPNQPEDEPKSRLEPWVSTHTTRWHSGEFFLLQDEHAMTGDNPFDTLSVMGVDATTGRYFAQTFENHGFARLYDVTVDGNVWTFTGATERARIEFSPDGRTQDQWLPLCDRIASQED